jgi:hypothetical protein
MISTTLLETDLHVFTQIIEKKDLVFMTYTDGLAGSKQMKIDEKLKFLYENDRQEQVGMYIRNKNFEDKTGVHP